MNTITSLLQFFKQSGIQCRFYEMGRRVLELDEQTFDDFEQCRKPYPFPLQHQAWLGLLCWPGDDTGRHFIWFLRLPLDETGLLAYAARDDLLHRLAQMAEAGLNGDAQASDQPLEDNPYGYKPTEERMAVFHAKALAGLDLPPSKYYAGARDYFWGEIGYDQWAFLGLQGIADVCARLGEDDNSARLAQAIPKLPPPPYEALVKCLENEALPDDVSEAVVARLKSEFMQLSPDPAPIALGLRALSATPESEPRLRLMKLALSSGFASDLNLLVTIAGRCWDDLHDPDIRQLFLQALAENEEGQEVFNKVLADLFAIPQLREPLMESLRDPERSDSLANAMGQFFAALRH